MSSLGESGFDEVRFGIGDSSSPPFLGNAIPLLMGIPRKHEILLREISPSTLGKLVGLCSAPSVRLAVETERPRTLVADLEGRVLSMSEDGGCGLYDLLLMAALFRVSEEFPDSDSLIREAQMTLADELPQAMSYLRTVYSIKQTAKTVFTLSGRSKGEEPTSLKASKASDVDHPEAA